MEVCLWLITSDRVFNPKQEYIMPVVRVSWFEGKEHAQKAAVAAEITESIVKNTGTPAEYIYVIFEDVAPSDWAGAGKLFGETPATP
ncbi:4-oxalocrotonate tautomerase [Pseudomonas syringae]|uniref:2-hydroxymuconate tautomerase n=5 Tax=Pseudomonas TaxID=286 RepID=A0AAJ4B1V8_PSESX|nr:4-oxalocrotonate tautomerase [Pseudomonas syringae pv. aceris]MCF4982856.1 4-oxalocrotonate tautomerase [Pseudomonas syringae]POQ00139.1 4-oxalocrotonate tautomerase [Pseudomonas syringae pv. syringae]QHF08742.1 4-oxalocrotonate tautomerase [Pseudomonas syringae UB303]MCF5029201.1 4-oxalocrotonate tautomerase [Pseudomonas syringae]